MAYPFTEDHDMIREAARGFLQDWYDGGKGIDIFLASGNTVDVAAWHSFAAEQGMAGIAIDESYGGAGLGDLGRVVVMEELGASLCPVPFLTTCGVVADLLAALGSDNAKQSYLPKIAAGELSASYCDGHDVIEIKDQSLSGVIRNVAFADDCDVLVVSARTGNTISLYAIDRAKVLFVPLKTMDPLRGVADVKLQDISLADVTLLGEATEEALNEVTTRSHIALAAECLGGAQACLDMTLEYTGQRVQFDRTIASFQAVKHRCADMFVEIEAARSAVYYAATAPEDEKTEAALAAKAYATDVYFDVAGTAIQLHGGIGFTWEYPLHFFFKRARANRSLFGSSARDYEKLAASIFGDAA